MSDNNNLSFITGALIGSVVGAGLALVFAPKTGRELRSDINRGTRQAMDKADDLRVTVQEKGSEYMDQARIKGSELKEKSSEMTKQVTEKDRKSTRLNSSHVSISYAVFCLKKKKKIKHKNRKHEK